MKLYWLTGAASVASMLWSVPALACHVARGPGGPVLGALSAHVTAWEIRAVGLSSGTLDGIPWDRAARAASDICGARGYRAGRFDGFESGGLPGILCLNAGISLFHVSIRAVRASGVIVGDLSSLRWDLAARTATVICAARGFAGGFFDGSRTPDALGLVCTGQDVGEEEGPEYGAPQGPGAPLGGAPVGEGVAAPPVGEYGAPPGGVYGAPPPEGQSAPPSCGCPSGHGAPPRGYGYGAPANGTGQLGPGAPPVVAPPGDTGQLGSGIRPIGSPPIGVPPRGAGQFGAGGEDLGALAGQGTGEELGGPSFRETCPSGARPGYGVGPGTAGPPGGEDRRFDVGPGDIARNGWSVVDVTRVSWAYAARIAYSLCVERGYEGGFFDGTRSSSGFGLSCVD